MVAMSNRKNGTSVILAPCQIAIQTANPRKRPTGAVCLRSFTTIVVTRASNGSKPVALAYRSNAHRCPSRRLRLAATTQSLRSSALVRADSIRTRASAQLTFPSPRRRQSKKICASSASGSSSNASWMSGSRRTTTTSSRACCGGRSPRRTSLTPVLANSGVALDVAHLAHVPPAIEAA